jgi:hypothetical protein
MAKVTLIELTGERREWNGRTISGVVQRVFGRGSYFLQNNGLPSGYGQIVRDIPNTGNGWSATVLKNNVRIDSEERKR